MNDTPTSPTATDRPAASGPEGDELDPFADPHDTDEDRRAAARPLETPPPAANDLPVVAVVGRPNVGKSTLFNRIMGRREAIVEERPGVTRDRKEMTADWRGREFRLVDTGGWMPGGSALDEKVSQQSEKAIAEADAVLFVVDATVGITEEDSRVANILRRNGRPVLLVANKVDDTNREAATWELMGLGVGDPYPVSALHGRGTGDLLDELLDVLPPEPEAPEAEEGSEADEEKIFSVSIVGRPNVGKSTLFNRLIGDDRSVVHDMPGTTRDAVDTVVETPDGPVRFVDTAGMRRRSKIDEGTEYYSLVRALQAIDRSDVALLVIDATIGVTAQDQRLAERIDAAGCPVVVVLNKWEVLDNEQREEVGYQISQRLHFIGESPVLKISALTGKGVHKMLPALAGTIEDYHRRVPTRKVNQVIRAAQAAQPAPHGAKVLYATQGATDPPTFTLFANKEMPASYLRYLERSLREAFDMGATPIKMRVRKRD
jgi:GTPase